MSFFPFANESEAKQCSSLLQWEKLPAAKYRSRVRESSNMASHQNKPESIEKINRFLCFWADRTISIERRKTMEQLWTALQSNDAESIMKIFGNSWFSEYRTTSIGPHPQERQRKSTIGRIGAGASSNMASYLNETESIAEISRSFCFLVDRTISIEPKENDRGALRGTAAKWIRINQRNYPFSLLSAR